MNCWEVLGLEPNSDKRTIKRAYSKLIKVNRPDDDPEKFQEIRQAYERCLKSLEEPSFNNFDQNLNQSREKKHEQVFEQIVNINDESVSLNENVSIDDNISHDGSESESKPILKKNENIISSNEKYKIVQGFLSEIETIIQSDEIEFEKKRRFSELLKNENLYIWEIKKELKENLQSIFSTKYQPILKNGELSFSLPLLSMVEYYHFFEFSSGYQQSWFDLNNQLIQSFYEQNSQSSFQEVVKQVEQLQNKLYSDNYLKWDVTLNNYQQYIEYIFSRMAFCERHYLSYQKFDHIFFDLEIIKFYRDYEELKNDIMSLALKKYVLPRAFLTRLERYLENGYLEAFESPKQNAQETKKGEKSSFGCGGWFAGFFVLMLIVRLIGTLDSGSKTSNYTPEFEALTPQEQLLKIQELINKRDENKSINNNEDALKRFEKIINDRKEERTKNKIEPFYFVEKEKTSAPTPKITIEEIKLSELQQARMKEIAENPVSETDEFKRLMELYSGKDKVRKKVNSQPEAIVPKSVKKKIETNAEFERLLKIYSGENTNSIPNKKSKEEDDQKKLSDKAEFERLMKIYSVEKKTDPSSPSLSNSNSKGEQNNQERFEKSDKLEFERLMNKYSNERNAQNQTATDQQESKENEEFERLMKKYSGNNN